MPIAPNLAVVACGFISIAAQSILFRTFLSGFNGNDLGIGMFFSSWLFWIGIGSLFAKMVAGRIPALHSRVPELIFCYLPLSFFQLFLLNFIREISGISSIELFLLDRLVWTTFFVQMPVAFLTGFVFPLLAGYLYQDDRSTVLQKVFTFETFGGCLGGAAATIVIAIGMATTTALLLTNLVVVLLLYGAVRSRSNKAPSMYLVQSALVILIVLYLEPVDWLRRYTIERSYPGAKVLAMTDTDRGTIDALVIGKQDVFLYDGLIAESIPDEEGNGSLTGSLLAQNKGMSSVLIIGPRFGLALTLAKLPTIARVYFHHPDPGYYPFVDRVLRAEGKGTEPGKIVPVKDILGKDRLAAIDRLDCAAILLGDPLTAAESSYTSVEFLASLGERLNDGGVVAASFSGIENATDDVLINVGRAHFSTFSSVFSHLALQPGSQSLIFAAMSATISDDPEVLRQRLTEYRGGSGLIEPARLAALFPKDRIRSAKELYRKGGDGVVSGAINSREKPLGYLLSLLLFAGYGSSSIGRVIDRVLHLDSGVILAVILLFAAGVVVLRIRRQKRELYPVSYLLLPFCAGFASMILYLAMLYRFQAVYGSLFLMIPVFSMTVMIGIYLGALLVNRKIDLLCKGVTLCLAIVVSIATLLFIAALGSEQSLLSYFPCFFFAGALSGYFFQVAARLYQSGTDSLVDAGAFVETADHFGAALGGLICGMIAIPVLGTEMTIILTALVMALPLTVVLVPDFAGPDRKRSEGSLALLAMVLFWFVGAAILIDLDIKMHRSSARPNLESSDLGYFHRQTVVPFEREDDYFRYTDESGLVHYVLGSADHAPSVKGYGGKINVIADIDDLGVLRGFFVKRHRETTHYFLPVLEWATSLIGGKIEDLDRIDGLSGATVSAKALTTAIAVSARNLPVLRDRITASASKNGESTFDRTSAYLVIAILGAMVQVFNRRYKLYRQLFLLTNLFVGGLLLNAQLSFTHVLALIGLDLPGARPLFPLLFVVAIPIVTAIFGNIYCSSICPFGALQELLQLLGLGNRPADRTGRRRAGLLKYLICAVIIILYIWLDDPSVAGFDPLASIFAGDPSMLTVGFVLVLVFLAILFPRFWCRYFCPAGAFLAVIGYFKPFARFYPGINISRCDYAVRRTDQLDCLLCNRCIYPGPSLRMKRLRKRERIIFRSAIVIVLLILFYTIGKDLPAMFETGNSTIPAQSFGRPRKVDDGLIRTKIDQGKLSDKEAEFFLPLEKVQ